MDGPVLRRHCLVLGWSSEYRARLRIPVKRIECELGSGKFRFYPVLHIHRTRAGTSNFKVLMSSFDDQEI